jgi:hypothetical protein
MLPCFSALRLGRCRRRVRFAVLLSVPLNGATSKLFPSVVETATGLVGSTLSNSSTGLSRINANEFPCRTSILIISGDSLYIHCITVQALIFYPNIRSRGDPNGLSGCSNACARIIIGYSTGGVLFTADTHGDNWKDRVPMTRLKSVQPQRLESLPGGPASSLCFRRKSRQSITRKPFELSLR